MTKELKRLLRRKPIRRKKIGRYEEKMLNRRGFNDINNGIVRKNPDQKYSSPFLKQEISLCLVQINSEKQSLAEILLFFKNEIAQKQLYIEKLLSRLNEIETPENPANSPTAQRYDGEETMMESFVQSLRVSEYYQKLDSRRQQKSNITTDIKQLEISKEEDQATILKEIEITRCRCRQHYNLLLARLSAYWNGVLKVKKDNASDIPPIFYIEDLLHDLHHEINILGKEEASGDGKESC